VGIVPDNLSTIDDYTPEAVDLVRCTCLSVATVLGDWLEHVTVVGGLVPSLLVDQAAAEPHAGTVDLDLGLQLVLRDEGGYASIAELLRRAGFRADVNEDGQPTLQRWRTAPEFGVKVTVDFLIEEGEGSPPPGKLQHLEGDFAAIATRGLHLATRHRRAVRLTGRTLRDEVAERTVYVCGPGAFVILKAFAVQLREKRKDAYDLSYLLGNLADGVPAIAGEIQDFQDDADAMEAIGHLASNFATFDSIGPQRAAKFLHGPRTEDNADDFDNEASQALALVQDLLTALRSG